MNGSLLLVDDEPNISKALQRELRADGYKIFRATSGREGLEILTKHSIDVIISDQRMPGMTGSEFLTAVQNDFPETIRILLSGYADFQAVVDAVNEGAIYKFWLKPWDSSLLRQQVRSAFLENRRLLREQQYNQVIDTAIEGVIMTDLNGRIESANPAIEALTGFKSDELVGKNYFENYVRFHKQDALKEILYTAAELGEWKGELCGVRKDGSCFTQQLSITGFCDRHEQLSHLAIFALDITQQKEQELRADFLVHHDEVTGLPNRRLFNDKLAHSIKSFSKEDDYTAILSLEIQRFDSLTENLGRELVEHVLRKCADRLQNVVPEPAVVACFGDDQFAILLPNIGSEEIAEQLVNSILSNFEQALCCADYELYLRVQLGLAYGLSKYVNAEQLLHQADSARRQAKENKQSYCIQAAAMDPGMKERWLLEHALPKAISNGEFEIVYQPKVDSHSGMIHGMEALLRWNHPEWGMISPDTFIPIAEETGLIVEIGEWCLFTACEQAKKWHAQGFEDLCLAVNLSARQLKDPGLYETVKSTLNSLNYPAHLLELEITETYALDNDESVLTIMRKLRGLGIGLAADDFGTGYASIDYIKRFPFTTLKVDRSFISELGSKQDDLTILESILMMAKRLSLMVVAEGVESESQFELLRQKGCELVQGYFFSKPLTIEGFTAMLAGRPNFIQKG